MGSCRHGHTLKERVHSDSLGGGGGEKGEKGTVDGRGEGRKGRGESDECNTELMCTLMCRQPIPTGFQVCQMRKSQLCNMEGRKRSFARPNELLKQSLLHTG